MKTLYDKKSRELILLSNVIEDYPKLKIFLLTHNKATMNDLADCDFEVRNIFDNKLFSEIEKQARSEWQLKSEHPEIVHDYVKNLRTCEYCGKKHIKYVFTIENRNNGNLLDVGSTCVVDLGIKTTKEMTDFEKNAKRLFRLTELNKDIPNIKNIVEQITSLIETSDIIVTEPIRMSYIESGKKIRDIFYKYLDNKTTDKDCPSLITELQEALKAHKEYENEVKAYITQNQNEIFVAKKTYVPYVRNIPQANDYMQKNGYVNKLSVVNISESSFIRGLIPKINEILSPHGISVLDVNKDRYEYTMQDRKELFYILHEKLMGYLIEGLFDEPLDANFSQISILSDSTFVNEKSYEIAISWLVEHTVYDYELNIDLNEIIFYPKKESEKIYDSKTNTPNAILHQWNQFARKFSRVMLTRDGYNRQEVVAYIFSGERIVYAHHHRMRIEIQQNPTRRRHS